MPEKKKFSLAIALFIVAAAALFSVNLSVPDKPDMDEIHYIPAAKQFLAGGRLINYEHPPLAKELMAVGVAVAGDRPAGWRLMSVVFGVATLAAVFVLAMAVFSSVESAVWATTLALLNQTLYVQARIAMLDTFLAFFMVAAFAAWAWTLSMRDKKPDPRAARGLALTGMLLGLASACKWTALVPWGVLGVYAFAVGPKRWRVSRPRIVLLMLALPLSVYFLTYLPLLALRGENFGFFDIFRIQQKMWIAQMQVGADTHSYVSPWYEWPFMSRPTWYLFEQTNGIMRGVVFLTNPLIQWGGLIATAILGVLAFWSPKPELRKKSRLIVGLWLLCYAPWAVLPRKLAFFYYYYPATLLLPLALVGFIDSLEISSRARRIVAWAMIAVTFALFVYFWPVISGSEIATPKGLSRMWFTRWI